MRIVNTRTDIEAYVADYTLGLTEEQHKEIVSTIRSLENCPEYGTDWSEFLSELPVEVFQVTAD